MSLQHFPMIAEPIKNGSLPSQSFSDAQASILDFLLFPGFTRMSTAIQEHLAVDLSLYIPLLCISGLLVFVCKRICQCLLGWLETYCTSTVHVPWRNEAYEMLMTWVSNQDFARKARSTLASTELISSIYRSSYSANDRDINGKSLYYTPWNGRFYFWYRGHLLIFRRYHRAEDFTGREEVSLSCFGGSQFLRDIMSECKVNYSKLIQDKTSVFEYQDKTWTRSTVTDIRPISTVILNESAKRGLLKDIGDFLDPRARKWYANRGIPYRRGCLLYGPPGTGKSSLSVSIAGHFGLDIYTLNLSTVTEDDLRRGLAKLPSRCVLLLEDIDAVSLNRDTETEDSSHIATISLSTLLNFIDGVGSQEGRVLIMTTNHMSRLDEALIRPGRVDTKVELGLADSKMTADLFRLIFNPMEGDVDPPEDAQSGGLLEDRKTPEAAWGQNERAEIGQLAEQFAAKVPELKFSPAEIQSFLLANKQSPSIAVANVDPWMTKIMEESKKAKNELQVAPKTSGPAGASESAKTNVLGDALPETKPEFKAEVHCSSVPPTTPTEMVHNGPLLCLPVSPPDSPPLYPVSLSDDQTIEMANAITAIKMAPTTLSPHFSSSETFLGNPPPTPAPCPNCTMKSSLQVATEIAQQLVEALRSVNTKQEPPPPAKPFSASYEDKSEGPKARASTLEFKKVTEKWDKKEYKYQVVESLTPPDKESEYDHYIFVVRTRIDRETKKQIQYVDINSSGLRDILRKVLQDVQGICLHEEKPSVEQSLLYHYLSDLEECRQNPSAALDRSTLEHLDLLLDFIRTAYASTTESLSPLLAKGQITYDLLWTLFKPNTLAYTTCFGTGQPRCVRYEFGEEKKARGGIEYFHVTARYLDFDGDIFGETSSDHAIEKFRGAKQITALEVFPLTYHPREKHVRAHLTECGRKFLSIMNVHLCEYDGKAFYIEKERVVPIFIKSRVMVDAVYFRQENPDYKRPSIKESDKSSSGDNWIYLGGGDGSEKSSSLMNSNGIDASEVKGDDLLICSPTVPGFSFGNSTWAELAVADLKEINWKQAALDDLHIPTKKKTAVLALSEAYIRQASTNNFDDVVEGKGQGFNVLLHGPPGVGKTLTAELLAEHLQKPLMQVSAGVLGTTAEAVEQQLPGIFKRASRWKAILLLDEADVLLEQRSSHDIHRNALVCVFLRTLEYYQGMMFLTTNRVGQVDDAIASRIHFKLKYNNLNLRQRTSIWLHFLEKAATPQGAPNYSQKDFDSWVRKERNGREIKNLVSTARALATQEGREVTMSHMDVAIDACGDFEHDVNGAGSTEVMNSYF